MRRRCQPRSVSGVTSQPCRRGERGGYRAEQAPVVIVEVRAVDVAAEYAELVAQHDDLEVL